MKASHEVSPTGVSLLRWDYRIRRQQYFPIHYLLPALETTLPFLSRQNILIKKKEKEKKRKRKGANSDRSEKRKF